MDISWGYSPKTERYIPLGDFPVDRYLVIARQAIENLGWNLSHISENGLIAYTSISWQSYSEEISIRIDSNFAIAKSECVGIQMWFNDYGKNSANIDRFFHEFEYVEFHLKDTWEDSLSKFHEFVATQDPNYFEKAPLTTKNKIKNVLYLFYPRTGYLVTPLLIWANFFSFGLICLFSIFYQAVFKNLDTQALPTNFSKFVGANNRELVLSGQYWRLITYQFIHLGIFHLFFNMYALVYTGLMIEHKIGSKKLLLIYILSGICGGLLSVIFHDEGYMIGASGSIFGLFGAFIALLINGAFEKNATKAMLISTLVICAIMLLNGITGNTDNSAHVGGLLGGFITCYLINPVQQDKTLVHKKWSYGALVILLLGFATAVLVFTPNYERQKLQELEKAFKQNTIPYNTIYRIPKSLPTARKLSLVKNYGVKVWERNKQICDSMKTLVLNKEQQLIADYYSKITNKTLEFVRLLYKECEDDETRYKREMDQVSRELYELKSEANEKVNRYWP